MVRPVFQKTYQKENVIFRDAGRELAKARDAQSIIEGFDRLIPSQPDSETPHPFVGIRQFLIDRRNRIAGEQSEVSETLAELSEIIAQSQQRIENWKLKSKGFAAIAGGLETTYSRAQSAMNRANRKKAAVEDFHEWRKWVKYHWSHCRLLENLWKPPMKARCQVSKKLAELLGEERDYLLLEELLNQESEAISNPDELPEFFLQIMAARKLIQGKAFPLGKRIFADKPKHLVRRFQIWWDNWHDAD